MKRWSLVTVCIVLIGTACTTSEPGQEEVLVSAAASLTDAFEELEAAFETKHPEFDVVVNLGGSSALREQILAGAPVDVFASANTRNMQLVGESGRLVGPTVVFATNRLAIAVPRGNTAELVSLSDLSRKGLLIGLCADVVPCGSFAAEVLANAGVVASVDTYEPDVRALLTKIESDELDAGIVYETDIAARSDLVDGITIPDELNVVADYPIAVLDGGDNVAGGKLFVDFVVSDEGRAILSSYGFGSP